MALTPRHIFVYGTLRTSYTRLPLSVRALRPPQILQMRNQWVGTAFLAGYCLYDLGRYPGVIKHHSETATSPKVVGDVFLIDDSSLPLLDEFEGISEEIEHPHEYVRVPVNTILQNGEISQSVLCWLYLYNWPIPPNSILVQSGDYVLHCEQRAREGSLWTCFDMFG